LFSTNKNNNKMENNPESTKGAFEAKLKNLMDRVNQATDTAADIWLALFGMTELPVVRSLDGKAVLPLMTVLTQINQHNRKMRGLLEAVAVLDPEVVSNESEDNKVTVVEKIEKIFKPVEERLDEIKKLEEIQKGLNAVEV